jgi:hypothetical protein
MLEEIRFLTGQRAYEFRPDDLRLSTISTKPIQDAIKALFNFQSSTIGTPMPTFGEVPPTFPPGIVFNVGTWKSPENKLTSIRFLHFEPRRIVIDVAGNSDALTSIYEQLHLLLNTVETVDGAPLVGKPERILDYSEISFRFPLSGDVLLPQPLRQLLSRRIKGSVIVPTVIVQSFTSGQELSGTATLNDHHAFTLAPRAGMQLDDRLVYFSSAPLVSEAHLSYLNELEAAFN